MKSIILILQNIIQNLEYVSLVALNLESILLIVKNVTIRFSIILQLQKICPKCYVDIQYLDCIICKETYKLRYPNQVLCPKCGKISQRLNGQRHIIQYNKSEIGRKKSGEIGKITIKYAINAQQSKNGKRLCEKCNFETIHICGIGCLFCHNTSGIGRENFYQSYIGITSYNSINELVKDFDSLIGVSGVWEVKGCDNVIYDVCQTKDIGSEMYEYLRRLRFNKDLSDDEIMSENLRYNYNRRKYRDILKDVKSVDFILVSRDIDSQNERELIEAQRAIDTRAKYWSPAPNQIKLISNFQN